MTKIPFGISPGQLAELCEGINKGADAFSKNLSKREAYAVRSFADAVIYALGDVRSAPTTIIRGED